MDAYAVGMFVVLFGMILVGFHVAFALLISACVFGYLAFGVGVAWQVVDRIDTTASNSILAAIPLFVFMGAVLERSGIAERLFNVIRMWTHRLPGGLAIATLLMCGIFAASTGVIGATEVVVGLLAIPSMMKHQYDRGLISGTICAGGSLGTIIPPSVVLIVMGPLAQVSVGRLFAAAVIPGVLLITLYCIYVALFCLRRSHGQYSTYDAVSSVPMLSRLVETLKALLPVFALITLVLGSILAGLASPTEAAAVGALGALVLAICGRVLTLRNLWESTINTVVITSMIMFIILAGTVFTGVFFSLGGGQLVTNAVMGLDLGPWYLLVIILLIGFLLGFFLEWISILMICMPIFVPVIVSLEFDPIWFCILFLIVIQTSYITPPMAPAIFYLRGIAPKEITLFDMYRGVLPFLLIQFILLFLVLFWPNIALWLPSVMFG